MISAVMFAVFLLQATSCFCFHSNIVVHQDQGRRRLSRFDGVLSSSVADEPSTERTTLDESIQLKDDLVALAAATRRGVSRRYMHSTVHMKVSYSHILFNSYQLISIII